MAVPKSKTSKARRDKRRNSTWKLTLPGLVKCAQCGALILPHRACSKCGYYKGREVVKTADKAAE
ncbi:MAG: 50S ribosomal protein L32 [Clostridia bacterium]|nr:50S ribosomal protein L32 [Clostridia bacterium]MBQ3095425.1 50S ribosomal protein L32 [Clostridia bacterium]MBR6557103.1 50S ribosomal protein L32 [Clostridia bacterium]